MKRPSSSMQLTRAAEYGVRVMISVGRRPPMGASRFPRWPRPRARRKASSPKFCRHWRAQGSSPRGAGRLAAFVFRRVDARHRCLK